MNNYLEIIKKINSRLITEAKAEINKQLKENSNDNNLYNFLGVCDALESKVEDAIISFKKCIEINPNNYDAHFNLALNLEKINPENPKINFHFQQSLLSNDYNKFLTYGLHLQRKNNVDAEKYLLKALNLDETKPIAYIALLDFYISKKRFNEGLKIGFKALSNFISHEGIFYNLGLIHQKLKKNNLALENYNKVIELNKNHADTYNNIGLIYYRLKNYTLAEENLEKSLKLKPNSVAALNNLGSVYMKNKKILDSLRCFKNSLQLDKKNSQIYNNLGQIFKSINNYNLSEKFYKKAIQIEKNDISFFSNYIYTLSFNPNVTQNRYIHEVKKINDNKLNLNFSTSKFTADKNIIGFVSADLRKHPVGFFCKETIKELSKKFEIHCFNNTFEQDELSEEIKSYCKNWTNIFNLNTSEARQEIQNKKIYYLFDLSGHTALNRLDIFLARSAPIQISWCGWLASTGVKQMGYFIADQHIYHDGLQDFFTEKLLVLDNIWNAYYLDKKFLEPNKSLPCERNGYLTFGAFHNSAKINDVMIKVWSKILENIPHSKLHLLARDFGDQNYIARTQKKFNRFGISQDRLVFSGSKPRQEFLHMYNQIDILLDTWPYGGGSSSFETIGMNVPLLTLKGSSFLQRCGTSINTNIGFDDLIANSFEDYIQIASKMTFDHLKKFKERLVAIDKKKSALFNSGQFADNMTNALAQIN